MTDRPPPKSFQAIRRLRESIPANHRRQRGGTSPIDTDAALDRLRRLRQQLPDDRFVINVRSQDFDQPSRRPNGTFTRPRDVSLVIASITNSETMVLLAGRSRLRLVLESLDGEVATNAKQLASDHAAAIVAYLNGFNQCGCNKEKSCRAVFANERIVRCSWCRQRLGKSKTKTNEAVR